MDTGLTDTGTESRPPAVAAYPPQEEAPVAPGVIARSAGFARRLLLGVSARQTSFAARGFQCSSPATRDHLERVGAAFVHGYNCTLGSPDSVQLVLQLNRTPPALRGFAYEGAAMACSLLDSLGIFGGGRWRGLAAAGDPYIYLLYIGMGWAWARLPMSIQTRACKNSELLRWLAVDGCGFHCGYFQTPKYVSGQGCPRGAAGYTRRAFDQGLGRSLWFSRGASAHAIAATIASFAPVRRADLWSGVGIACAYAGGVDAANLGELLRLSGDLHASVAQGVAFAAEARSRAGNPASWTELACETICAASAAEIAATVRAAQQELPVDGEVPAYEVWRARVQAALGGRTVAARREAQPGEPGVCR